MDNNYGKNIEVSSELIENAIQTFKLRLLELAKQDSVPQYQVHRGQEYLANLLIPEGMEEIKNNPEIIKSAEAAMRVQSQRGNSKAAKWIAENFDLEYEGLF